MKEVVMFGAGKIGQDAYYFLKRDGKRIAYYVDNSERKWGQNLNNIPIKSFDDFVQEADKYELILTCNQMNVEAIEEQLKKADVKEYSIFDEMRLMNRESIVSYAHPHDMEDVILYHILHDEDNIFYIDVGSNSPTIWSVTKLLYDKKNARGINIEPQKNLIEISKRERVRDINLCVGVGDKNGTMELFVQGYLGNISTVLKNGILRKNYKTEVIEVMRLEEVCNLYVPEGQDITFLKVDVEGFEKNVLEGMDFKKYRPWIVVMESTLPMTMDFCHYEWEDILIANHYHFAYTYGVNRFYIADEREYLDDRFCSMDAIRAIYKIYQLTEME